jgi:hypothetical protein
MDIGRLIANVCVTQAVSSLMGSIKTGKHNLRMKEAGNAP